MIKKMKEHAEAIALTIGAVLILTLSLLFQGCAGMDFDLDEEEIAITAVSIVSEELGALIAEKYPEEAEMLIFVLADCLAANTDEIEPYFEKILVFMITEFTDIDVTNSMRELILLLDLEIEVADDRVIFENLTEAKIVQISVRMIKAMKTGLERGQVNGI